MIRIAFLLLFWLNGCDHKPSDTEFAQLYADLRIASTAYGDTTPTARLARQNILMKYGWNAAQFEKYARDLRDNPERWNLFQTQVVERLDSLRAQSSFPATQP